VGFAETFAKFYVNNIREMLNTLKELSEKEKPTPAGFLQKLFKKR
jgi:hypothetical protein